MDDATSVLELPDDPVELKRVIAQRDSVIAQQRSDIDQIKREAAERIESMQQRHKAEMNAILRRFYGPHAERFDPTQLLLFGLKVAEQMPVDDDASTLPSQRRSDRTVSRQSGTTRCLRPLPHM
jgi:hypothetical protein